MLRVEFEARSKGISQTEVATRCGVSTSLINRVFRGVEHPYPKIVRGIADALDWPQERAAELFEQVEVR